MRVANNNIVLAATDVSNFLNCGHRSALDFAAASGLLPTPESRLDAALRLLRERGEAHERAYVEYLRNQGLAVVEICADETPDSRVALTLEALRSGVDAIYQGAFAGGGWIGYSDLLVKTPFEGGTAFGDFGYEPYDMKLARETRGATILQLALYAELLSQVQGRAPHHFFVVTPGDPFNVHEYRLTDYHAYFRSVRARMLEVLAKGAPALLDVTYPEPVEHCDVCRWWERCNQRRRADDHLSFIAGVTKSQRTEFAAQNITTLGEAASLRVPVPFKPSRGARESYDRVVEQARVQLEQREKQTPVFEALPILVGRGFSRLPEPSSGDLFLDLEGARFVREGGHDYLFGLGLIDSNREFIYQSWWAFDSDSERGAFETLMDVVSSAVSKNPDLHIYHFGAYEVTALKRLAGRYATRQDPLDNLLREERFVDLYSIVKQALRAGVESYSIKELEQYYAFHREVPLRDASVHRIAVETALEARDPSAILNETRATVEAYNRDDVVSTWRLREWLEKLRDERVAAGVAVPRPTTTTEEVPISQRAASAEALRKRILAGLKPEAASRANPDHGRWLLAYLIDWHHREEKAAWWEFFRLRDLPEDDLIEEPKAIAGLNHLKEVGPVLSKKGKPTGSTIHRYSFPSQDVELVEGDKLKIQDGSVFGTVTALDRVSLTINIKRGKSSTGNPSAAFCMDVVGTGPLQDSVMRFAERLDQGGYNESSAGVDLLYRKAPRLRTGAFTPQPGESTVHFAARVVPQLDRTTLSIQGPPGAGKTYLGAKMILTAVANGLRVGITATSHKVIQNLCDAVLEQADKSGQDVRLARKPQDGEEVPTFVKAFTDNAAALAAVRGREVDILGGTAWLWSDENAVSAVDLLFVDEAGQFSLANALAISSATNSMILLGDPKQLNQPQKATHPDGVDASALEHVLGESEILPAELGIFMPETWRLSPSVCQLTSEIFYAGALKPIASGVNQQLLGTGSFDGSGLNWIPVEHRGRRSSSEEEAEAIHQLIDLLLAGSWTDQNGVTRRLTSADLRVVAPYNAQVNRLAALLASRGVPVGTVDKFQGQTCAAVIYSMASSSPEDAPRGMEFLYSLNRLNVATSRGRCAAFIVASPELLMARCRTPKQMRLANALCRFVELAQRKNHES